MKRPLIILTGPTAVGKTALSIRLAKAVGGEIISADSMQVYKYMDIGTAKVTAEEMDGVVHHLIDVLEPEEDFNVVEFARLAKEAMDKIYAKGKIPIIAGGTGFYIQALLYDIDFTESNENGEYRQYLEGLAKDKGNDYLYNMLMEVDPASCEKIHKNNVKRVIRALEYYNEFKTPISLHNEEESSKETPYNALYFVLNDDRENVYSRIDKRVDIMFENGLVEEVQGLLNRGCKKDSVAMQGLGYKEVIAYLEGQISLEEAVYIIKRDTRHFAKRQITWFKREKNVDWINYPEFGYDTEKILEYMLDKIRSNNMI